MKHPKKTHSTNLCKHSFVLSLILAACFIINPFDAQFLQAQEVKKVVQSSPGKLKSFEGFYRFQEDKEAFLQITVKENKLVLKQLWDGKEFVLATPPKAPKLKALAKNAKVALTIDDNSFPHKVLLVRGTARLETVKGIVPEYAAAAERYFGREQGQAWVNQLRGTTLSMVRIAVTPEWVGILDFQTRFPSALSA